MNQPKSLKSCLQKYLMASYAYYIRYTSVMPDSEYDDLAKYLLEHWHTFEHQHKHLVSEEDLKAGTLFSLNERGYPLMIQAAAEMWIQDVSDKQVQEITHD